MDAYKVVRQFEDELAAHCGATYCVSVESCSAAIFLSIAYCKARMGVSLWVGIPRYTYPSVAASIVNNGLEIRWNDDDWQDDGWYWLVNTPIIDSAKLLARGMYKPQSLTCLSFHGKKNLSIGRGGAILTDNEDAANWLKVMRFDGRHECPLPEDHLVGPGWNMYMTTEQAARGLELLQWVPDEMRLPRDPYQDLSRYSFYRGKR